MKGVLEANILNPLWDDMNILLFAKNLTFDMFVPNRPWFKNFPQYAV